MGKLKIKFHPSFWIFLFFLSFSNNFFVIFSYLACVFLHEIGHFLMAGFLGYKLNKITFMPFGASLSGRENVFFKTRHEVLVSIAGPLTNLILMVMCLALFWCFPSVYVYLDEFYFANLTTLLFNFLPVFPLDGGRVILSIFKHNSSNTKALKYTKIVGFSVCIILFLLFIISSFIKINFTLGLTSIFLIIGLFFEDNSSYYQVNFSMINKNKNKNNSIESHAVCVTQETELYSLLKKLSRFKYNFVYVLNAKGVLIKILSEDQINSLFLNYPLNNKIGEILN